MALRAWLDPGDPGGSPGGFHDLQVPIAVDIKGQQELPTMVVSWTVLIGVYI